MFTIDLPESDRFDRYAALDIETDGPNGHDDRLVAIGVGFQPGSRDREVAVHTLSDARGDEARLIQLTCAWLDRREPAGVVTYNGSNFDLPFLRAKAEALDTDVEVDLPGRHVDLFPERQAQANRAGEKWPSLEDALADYSLRPAKTLWYDEMLTNTRFAEELAPRYIGALEAMEFGLVRALDHVIRDYTAADIHATLALYEADLGRRAPVE